MTHRRHGKTEAPTFPENSGPPASGLQPPLPHRSMLGTALQAYFRSGWAFLIPYLAAYLLYAWLKWPVDLGTEKNATTGNYPCLLDIYRALHALNVVLGAFAIRTWWIARRSHYNFQAAESWPLLPWLFLALLFWIPGVYLEWPADTWEHYSRINQWKDLPYVASHPDWKKFSYFLAYSLVGRIPLPLEQIMWLDVYFAACCLLLCWQYYRLARAVGLRECAAFVFVLLQILTLGNNMFGFYRYYGVSSTLFAQMAVIALIRTAFEALNFAGSDRSLPRVQPEFKVHSHSRVARFVIFGGPVTSILLLFLLMSFSHAQGAAMAGLGLMAVVTWRLVEWRRQMLGWLPLLAIVLSIGTLVCWPRHPALDTIYRAEGWLSPWHGFAVFDLNSRAFDRMIAILGIGGLVSLGAGLWLLRRNHFVGWLTVLPVAAMALPFVAIPLAEAFAVGRPSELILLYHRVFLVIPVGLAIVVAVTGAAEVLVRRIPQFALGWPFLMPLGLMALVLVPADRPYFNRSYHSFIRPPQDLSMQAVMAITPSLGVGSGPFNTRSTVLVANPGVAFVARATGIHAFSYASRMTTIGPTDKIAPTLDHIAYFPSNRRSTFLYTPSVNALYTPYSISAILSGHWRAQEVAYEYAGRPELANRAQRLGYRFRNECLYGFGLDSP